MDSLNPLVGVVASWLSRRAGIQVSSQSLLSNPRLRGTAGQIESSWANDRYPVLGSIRFSHPDTQVFGRQWVTEIGISRLSETSEIECTFLLQTNDISPRVSSLPVVTRPLIVRDILQQFPPAGTTAGVYIETLDEQSAQRFGEQLFSRDRQTPVVIVSPDAAGEYLVSVDRLQSLLIGLSEIAVIPVDANTFTIRDVLGFNYTSWLGAVNVIHPMFRQEELPSFRRLLPDHLAGLADPETEILSLVTHRMNLPLSWSLVSPAVVERERRSRMMEPRLAAAKNSGELAQFVQLLEEEVASGDARIAELNARAESADDNVAYWMSQAQNMESELREQRFIASQLEVALAAAPAYANTDSSAVAAIHGTLRRAIAGEPTLEDSLAIISILFPGRILVLDSARRSAIEARAFQYGTKAFELLWELATVYWQDLHDGKGDVEARRAFGQAFAATESETVASNPGATARRTFRYKDAHLTMLKHLKIGVKSSVAQTWRCHFEWLPEEDRIVIGHCGSHLDFH